MNAAFAYMDEAQKILERLRATQMETIDQAAEICTHTIANDGIVNLFGTGHSRMFVEEMFPRHGSFPGFHSMVELSLTFHNQVVGSNGQRQAMFLEKVEGLGKMIMRNFVFSAPDSFIIFSNSGVNQVIVEMALEAKARDLPVIAVVSTEHCMNSTPKHSCGKRLPELADVTIDTCVPAGDAMVNIDGLEDPVGPGSTIGAAAVTNALKCSIAEKLTALGKPPLVLSSSYFLGSEKAAERFDECYDDYRERVKRVYG
ncbi:MAG: SIS domain-containing protein [Chloroflexota bacterium]